MNKCLLLAVILLLSTLQQAHAQRLDQLDYLSDNALPLNYLEGGEMRGRAVDLLEQITASVGAPVKRSSIRVMPWARAYREALAGPDRVIFSIYRTPERDSLFKWACPIMTSRVVLVAKISRHRSLATLNDLDGYTIGAMRDDAAVEYLNALNTIQINVQESVASPHIARMLAADRIDMWAGGETGIFTELRAINADEKLYKVIGVLHEAQLCFAFSHNVDDALVEQFQEALTRLNPMETNPLEGRPINNNQPKSDGY